MRFTHSRLPDAGDRCLTFTSCQAYRPFDATRSVRNFTLHPHRYAGGRLRAIHCASKDDLLTNVCIYWYNNAIGSSMRLYKESRIELASKAIDLRRRVSTPVAVASFPSELPFWPRSFAEQFLNIERWTPMPRGGHFAAMEQPELLVEDVRAFFGMRSTIV